MSDNTKIEWCDATFNPWEGCQKVGPGCDFCYAETRNARYGGGVAVNWGQDAPRRRTSAANWRKPIKWNADAAAFAEQNGRKQRVFCASLADVFDNAVDPQWRADLFALIDVTPDLEWLLLTKRVGNVAGMLADMGRTYLPAHVWLGATVVNQAEADRDISKLLAVPVAVRFLSMEPLLGPVDLSDINADGTVLDPECWGDCRCDSLYGRDDGCRRNGGDGQLTRKIDWVIAGGESGPGARPMHPDWARTLRDQCAAAGVPFLFKQWGEWLPCVTDHDGEGLVVYPEDDFYNPVFESERRHPVKTEHGQEFWRVGKKAAGRLLDGVQHDGFPE